MNQEMQPVQLTGQGGNPTLKSEVSLYMANSDGGHELTPRPVAENTKPIVPTSPASGPTLAGPDQLRGEWHSVFGPRDLQNPDTRSAIEAAVGLNLGPQTGTSKGGVEQTARGVVENALLDDSAHAERAVKLLGKDRLSDEEKEELVSAHSERIAEEERLLKELARNKGLPEEELTTDKKIAFLRSHYVGYGETVEDGNPAGVFNFKQEQIAKKARFLKEGGFTKEQRRVTLESGLAAMPFPAAPTPLEARNQAIEDLAAPLGTPGHLLLTGVLAQTRDRIVELHNLAIARGEPGISSEQFLNYYKAYQENIKLTLGLANPTAEHSAFERRLKSILDLDETANGRSGVQDEFNKNYNFYTVRINPLALADPLRKSLEDERNKLVMDFAGSINGSAENVHDSVLQNIINSNNEEALVRLVFRIVALPLQSETSEYSLGFYGGINIDAITNLLQSLAENDKLTPNRHTRDVRKGQTVDINNIKEAMRVTHELNKYIITGKLDQAQQIADNVLPQYQQVLQRWKGVGNVERLLEAAHSVLVSKDGYINVTNDQEMMGSMINKVTGRFQTDQDSSVLAEFEKAIQYFKDNPALAHGKLSVFLDMKPWEIALAYNLGRNFFNNQQRKAEWTSQGQVPAGAKAWESTMLEGFNKILNPARWLYQRFTIGGDRGGMRWFDRFKDAMQRSRKREGYGTMQLEKIRDDDVGNFELPTMTGVRGFNASWRTIGMTLRQTNAIYEAQPGSSVDGYRVFHKEAGSNKTEITRETSLGLMLNTKAIEFEGGGRKISFGDKGADHMRADYFRSVFYKPGTGINGIPAELRDDLQSGLGAIYKVSLGPSGGRHAKDNREFNRVKEEIRGLIWQRAARETPLAVIPYLHGLKYAEGHNGGRTVLADVYSRPGVDWLTFQRKLNFLNELKLSKVRGVKEPDGTYSENPQLEYSLQDAIALVVATTGGYDPTLPPTDQRNMINLSPAETLLLQEVVREGDLASKDMANVKYAFIPFMHDIILEDTDYDDPGQEAFVRHFRDMAHFNGTNAAIAEAMDNLGEILKYEQMVEFIKKFAKGITDVHGDETAKDKAYAVTEATIAFFRRGENTIGKEEEFEFVGEEKLPRRNKIARWIKQQDEFHVAANFFHKPQSEAQMFYNSMEVLALDRKQVFNAMEKLKAAGLMGLEEEKDMRKRFGGFLGFLIRMAIEDLLRATKLGAAGVGWSLFGKSFEAKGAVE